MFSIFSAVASGSRSAIFLVVISVFLSLIIFGKRLRLLLPPLIACIFFIFQAEIVEFVEVQQSLTGENSTFI